MLIQFENNGALVPAIGIAPAITVLGITYIGCKALGVELPGGVYHLLLGVSLLLSGLINYVVRRKETTLANGEPYYSPSSFMWIDMGAYTYIYAFIGLCICIDAIDSLN